MIRDDNIPPFPLSKGEPVRSSMSSFQPFEPPRRPILIPESPLPMLLPLPKMLSNDQLTLEVNKEEGVAYDRHFRSHRLSRHLQPVLLLAPILVDIIREHTFLSLPSPAEFQLPSPLPLSNGEPTRSAIQSEDFSPRRPMEMPESPLPLQVWRVSNCLICDEFGETGVSKGNRKGVWSFSVSDLLDVPENSLDPRSSRLK